MVMRVLAVRRRTQTVRVQIPVVLEHVMFRVVKYQYRVVLMCQTVQRFIIRVRVRTPENATVVII